MNEPKSGEHIVVTTAKGTVEAPPTGCVAVYDDAGAFCFYADLVDLEALLARARHLLGIPLIDHVYVPNPWPKRDECDRKVSDDGRNPRQCGRPRKEHKRP